MKNNIESSKVNVSVSMPFGTVSWLVWVVFMILYYGTGTIANWPVFWIWFPFWLPFAMLGLGLVLTLACYTVMSVRGD